MKQPEVLSQHRCFGGRQIYYQHESSAIGLPMRFSVYLPPAAEYANVPAVLFLAGLTCNETTFMIKAGAQRLAAELGLALIAPDTSPRNAAVPGEADHWDFGIGAGFYVDAQQVPWSRHYRMESWILELLQVATASLPVDSKRIGISGHSMGGHGALVLALRHPGVFRSLSAFAPIANPTQCAWGEKAFSGYLGSDRAVWSEHDASELMHRQAKVPYPAGILVDQGTDDEFLQAQLHPNALVAACEAVGQPIQMRWQEGYDHGYFFIQSFIGDHLNFHAKQLRAD
ncbi:S-formylglutathione hydrolase [Azohydromonas australica]|uniref:S-formylglutathione hydrolase n=1 Tax=Azohydromonas australica TaxID=364039 RepID=UPI00041AE18D|nr:S-formylglutathione hydrolase [Azohydromonas australica]